MRVTLDNIIFSLQTMGGISVYWYELLQRLAHDPRCQLEVFQYQNIQRHLLVQEIDKIALRPQLESKLPVKLVRYLSFRESVSRQTLFHSSYYRIADGAKNIVTVYDFTYEYYRRGPARWLHSRQKSRAINHAAGIICISENTRRDLYRFFPNLDVPVEVIHIGKPEAFQVLAEDYAYGDTVKPLNAMKYALFVGARAGYKNFALLVEALAPCEDMAFVIVGPPLTTEEIALLQNRMAGRYVFQGLVNDVRLNELYNQAHCFIYPSEYEGFGLPVSEAMAAGCPVIALKRSSIPEVAGDAGLLCESLNTEILRQYFRQLDDPQQRQAIIRRGIHQAEQFSWDKCYAQTVDFYKKIDQLD